MNTIPIKHIRRGAKQKRNMARTSRVPGERRETSAAKTDNQQFKERQSRSTIKIIQQRKEGIILFAQAQGTTFSHLW